MQMPINSFYYKSFTYKPISRHVHMVVLQCSKHHQSFVCQTRWQSWQTLNPWTIKFVLKDNNLNVLLWTFCMKTWRGSEVCGAGSRILIIWLELLYEKTLCYKKSLFHVDPITVIIYSICLKSYLGGRLRCKMSQTISIFITV